MYRTIPAAFALLAISVSVNALAADPNASCPLLERKDLFSLGVTDNAAPSDSDWNWEKPPQEIPYSRVISNLCTINMPSSGGRSAVILAVDRFSGKVTEEQVRQWIKAVEDATNETGIQIAQFGETICETGSYELPTNLDDGSFKNVNELYVACDAQVGTRHVSLNVHVPEDRRNKLPSMERTKAILDKSIQHLKDATLGQRI